MRRDTGFINGYDLFPSLEKSYCVNSDARVSKQPDEIVDSLNTGLQ